MEINFFVKGLALGFAIAAPVGPIGILCIRKTLQYGRWSGLFSGLGAAMADTFYGIIAAFGLTLISNFLFTCYFWLHIVGGTFLLYLGWKTFFNKPQEGDLVATHKTLIKDFLSTFGLTLTNPMTILSYLAMFAVLGLPAKMHESSENAIWLVIGVFLGSSLWWLILSEGVTLFRKKINQNLMRWINRIAGLVISIFGLLVWIQAWITRC